MKRHPKKQTTFDTLTAPCVVVRLRAHADKWGADVAAVLFQTVARGRRIADLSVKELQEIWTLCDRADGIGQSGNDKETREHEQHTA